MVKTTSQPRALRPSIRGTWTFSSLRVGKRPGTTGRPDDAVPSPLELRSALRLHRSVGGSPPAPRDGRSGRRARHVLGEREWRRGKEALDLMGRVSLPVSDRDVDHRDARTDNARLARTVARTDAVRLL